MGTGIVRMLLRGLGMGREGEKCSIDGNEMGWKGHVLNHRGAGNGWELSREYHGLCLKMEQGGCVRAH